MDYKDIFNTAMLAGEIMAQSGAETFRVEDTMIRILKTSGATSVEVYATTTGIVASISAPDKEPLSGVKRIANRSNNLSRINDVNQISRNICDGTISIIGAYDNLIQIKTHKIYSNLTVAIASVVSVIGFAGLFGGSLIDCIFAGVNGLFIILVGKLVDNKLNSTFMIDAIKCFVLAFLTLIYVNYCPNTHLNIIIIGSLMPFVPGIPITNDIRDTLQGDYNSGATRALEAFVISLGIAVGVGFGMGFYHMIERLW